jgi:hypothetical protein
VWAKRTKYRSPRGGTFTRYAVSGSKVILESEVARS